LQLIRTDVPGWRGHEGSITVTQKAGTGFSAKGEEQV
jgi:hypothetical protein